VPTDGEAIGEAGGPRFIYLVGRIDRGIRRGFEAQLDAFGLSIPEYTALSVLQRRPGLSNAQLARRSLITPQSTIDVVSGLEERELIVRKAKASHARVLATRLTPAGRRLLTKADTAVQLFEEDLLRDVPGEHRDLLRQSLIAVMRRLQDRL
jgi:DNA-binding MarR family transcriptional regulator